MIPWRAAKRQLILLVFAAVLLLCYFGDMLTRSREAPLSSTLSLRPSKDPNHVDEPQLELVVAATKNENIAWLDSNLRGWLKTVYIVDDTEARPTVPTNKGREAMVYLTYVTPRLAASLMKAHNPPPPLKRAAARTYIR